VFAADIKNEPHGRATWGDGNLSTDWRLAAERIGAVVLEANPRLLVFVEGVEVVGGEHSWWGGCLAAAGQAPVRLPVEGKLVYSPHVYGPSVSHQPYFSDPSFPANLPAQWSRDFGCVLTERQGPAVVPGEWG
jgi:endoglucanase